MKRFKWYRKLLGGIWYKHELTIDSAQIFLTPGEKFWARYDEINRYSKIIETENYESHRTNNR
jgi:hypothetical protein